MGDADQGSLTREYVDFVLQLVARRLGVRTLAPAHYMAERERMPRTERARWLRGFYIMGG